MAGQSHRIELLGLHRSASPTEAAAVVAALERFVRDVTPALEAPEDGPDRWRKAALLEGVSREPGANVPDFWINA
jgi:hypothetical protein